jgi:uncharacterized repeat protein (TIGR03803 family)
MLKVSVHTLSLALAAFLLVAISANAETVVYAFKGPPADATRPSANLINVGGVLYGTTATGGTNNDGTVFSVTKSGAEKVVYSFCSQPNCADGSAPQASLISLGGMIYGTTYSGGSEGWGTVFSVTTAGVEKVIHSFGTHSHPGGDEGHFPASALIYMSGKFYGITLGGGHGARHSHGTVFSVTKAGVETVLYAFCAQPPTCIDGTGPLPGLINVGGVLYGTTVGGGPTQQGTVFSLTTAGVETTVCSCSLDNLINVGGTFYGTGGGGANNYGAVFSLTTAGVKTVLYSFCQVQPECADGADPDAGLINVKGTLYGTTEHGGANGYGTVFSVTTTGHEAVVYSFAGDGDGEFPQASLLNVGGVLYGTTSEGATFGGVCQSIGCGAVFSLAP